jgi:hypothetical protein
LASCSKPIAPFRAWSHWAERVEIGTGTAPSVEAARRELEGIAAGLNQKYDAVANLPWQAPVRRIRCF